MTFGFVTSQSDGLLIVLIDVLLFLLVEAEKSVSGLLQKRRVR